MTGSDGRRWLALDADMFAKRFTHDLYERFGWGGVAVWVAFLCACKQSRTPGRVRMASDLDGMNKLGIGAWELVDNKGEPWTLTEFFDFTGRKKQTRRVAVQPSNTRRIAAQRLLDVCATHWERWQDDSRTDAERARKRRWWAENRVEGPSSGPLVTSGTSGPDLDSDLDSDTPLPPKGGGRRRFASNGNSQPPTSPPVREWQPDPEPDSVIDRAVIANLRADPSGKSSNE